MKRRSNRERFGWHSVRNYVRKHRREYTDAEKYAAIHWFMVEELGALVCQCGRYWDGKRIDEDARQLGVTIKRSGEATLDMCPRCALYGQLFTYGSLIFRAVSENRDTASYRWRQGNRGAREGAVAHAKGA